MLHALATVMTITAMALTTSQARTNVKTKVATNTAAKDPSNAAQNPVSTKAKDPSGRRAQTTSRPAAKAPEFQFHAIEARLISATNRTRAQYGLPPLQVDYRLMHSARRHAAWMTRSRSLHHTSAMVAENIAMGQRSVQGVMSSWMTSPGHRANILNGGYRRIGVAAYRTPEGTIYWCQQFMW